MNTHFFNNVHPPDLFLRSPLHFSKNSVLLSGYFPLLLLCFLLRVQICLSMWEYFQPRLPWSSQMDPRHSFLYLQRRTSKDLRSMVWHYRRLISVHVAPALALPHNEAQRLQISCMFRFPRLHNWPIDRNWITVFKVLWILSFCVWEWRTETSRCSYMFACFV